MAVVALVAATAILTLAFWFNWWPPLRGHFGWRWPYDAPGRDALRRLLPGLAASALYGAGLAALRKGRALLYVSWCILGATILPVALLYILGEPLFVLLGRTITPGTTGGYSLGMMLSQPWEALRDWPAWMGRAQTVSSHMAISPPGWPLLYALISRALDRMPAVARWLAGPLRDLQCHHVTWMALSDGQVASAWVGIASPLWAALSLLPLYGALCRLTRGAAAQGAVARQALAWWALVPSLALFTGTLATPYPLLSNTALWLLVRGLAPRRAPWLMAAGALTLALALVSFSLLPLALTWALVVALEVWAHEEPWARRVRALGATAAWCCVGAGGAYALYAWLTGVTPWAIFRASMSFHLSHIERPYWPWLALHTWDYALFLGPPLLALSLAALRHWRQSALARLSLATALTLAALVISGTGRGETGRIWLFFMPLSLAGAAEALERLRPGQRLALALAQVAWLMALATVLRPVGHTLSPAPKYIAPVASSWHAMPPARWGETLYLDGWGAAQQGDRLLVTLHWRASDRMASAYRFSALLVSPEGPLPQAVDWEPLEGRFPTTCWATAPQGAVTDRVALPLEESRPPGEWWLSLVAYTLDEQGAPQRLPILAPDGRVDDQLGLGPIALVDP